MATIEVSTLENNSIQINIDNNEENNYIAKLENEIGNLAFLIEKLTINMDKKEKQIKRLENIIREISVAGHEIWERLFWSDNFVKNLSILQGWVDLENRLKKEYKDE